MATTLTTYLPFDAGAGADVTEAGWRDMARHWLQTGVLADEDNEFAVSQRAAGANMSVDVATGKCWIRGHYGAQTSLVNLAVATADPTNPRIDRVILRADFAANRIELDVLTGTPAASPTAPALTQSSTMWEIALAQVSVPAADTTIETAQITDQRTLVTADLSGTYALKVVTFDDESSTTDTLALTDGGLVKRYTNAAAVTVTVPPNSDVAFPTGTAIELYAAGAGGVAVAAGVGVTVRNAGTIAQYATAVLTKHATDEWVLTGAAA